MFRFSFVVIAIAAALTLNGCSQCSSSNQAPAPAAPAEVLAAPAEAPAAAPAAPAEAAAPVEGAAAPAEGAAAPAATPVPASGGAH